MLLDRQNTFKPVFGALMKGTPPERQHASHLRRMLAENCVDFEICKTAYEKSTRDGLNNILITQVINIYLFLISVVIILFVNRSKT